MKCTPIWDMFRSRTAIFWVVIIQWVACTEMEGGCIYFLGWSVFKDLNLFSLQLYLTHERIANIIIIITGFVISPSQFWQLDLFIMSTYAVSYAFYLYVQPCLDWVWPKKLVDSVESPQQIPSDAMIDGA